MSPRTAPVMAIAIGERDREEMGDISALAESIRAVGLLHPVVVTESLTLVAGGRRLEAVRSLGWTEVPVTVVDLTTVADALRAEADENTQRKPLTPYEAARARERRSKVLAEDAAKRRQQGAAIREAKAAPSAKLAEGLRLDGMPPAAKARAMNSIPPVSAVKPAERETRKAAAVGTGYSGSTLDKVDLIRNVAERGVVETGRGKAREEVPVPQPVREVARRELEEVKQTGAAVDRAHRTVAAAIEAHLPPDPDEPHRKWRREFLAALGAARKPMQFTPEAVAERADDECLDELRRLIEDMATYQARIKGLVAEATPDNVRQLRAM